MSQLPPPVPPAPAPRREWTSTMFAVAVGVIVGVLGLIIIAVAVADLADKMKGTIITAAIVGAVLAVIDVRNRRHGGPGL